MSTNPKSDMIISFTKWSEISENLEQSLTDLKGIELLIPGGINATIGELRETVASSLEPPVEAKKVVLIYRGDPLSPIASLTDNEKELIQDCHIFPGSKIIIDIIASSENDESSYISPAIEILEKIRKRTKIVFNNPMHTENEGENTKGGLNTLSVDASLDDSLADLKLKIASMLSLTAESFYVKKSANGPQFKDESKTLSDLALISESIVYLQNGKGCGVGEHLLNLEIDLTPIIDLKPLPAMDSEEAALGISIVPTESRNGLIPLGEVPVSEKSTIQELKQLIFDNYVQMMSKLRENEPWLDSIDENIQKERQIFIKSTPPSINHFRIRDCKTGKPSAPLRGERQCGRCLIGLTDGRKLLVQVLPEEEIINQDDIVISVRAASYATKSLYPPVDLPFPRENTVKNLFEKLLQIYPQLNEPFTPSEPTTETSPEPKAEETTTEPTALIEGSIGLLPECQVMSFARGVTNGPPLTLKTALKLKWDEEEVLKEPGESPLDRPPLNLHDGSIIVIRGKADFRRYEEEKRRKKQEKEASLVVSAGTGTQAVKAKAKAAKIRIQSGRKRKEGVESFSAATLQLFDKGDALTDVVVAVPSRPPPAAEVSSESPSKKEKTAEGGPEIPPEKDSPSQVNDADVLEGSADELPPPLTN